MPDAQSYHLWYATAVRTDMLPDSPSPGSVAARLVRELDRVRMSRGESKADVARATGLGEPAVRRLFSGRHPNPTVRTLETVAAHLGLRLSLEEPPDDQSTPTLAELRSQADVIEGIVTQHGGSNVRVFGSVARDEARPGSDIDLLIDVKPGTGLLELGAIEDELATVLGRRVDVITSGHGRMRHIHDEALPLR